MLGLLATRHTDIIILESPLLSSIGLDRIIVSNSPLECLVQREAGHVSAADDDSFSHLEDPTYASNYGKHRPLQGLGDLGDGQ